MATINGTNGNDTRNGTAGADLISGLAGNDVLNGLGGNDTLRGGFGNDRLDGGIGTDIASWLDITGGGVTASLLSNSASGAGGTDMLLNIENLEGSNQNDTLTGNANANTLWGRNGNDNLQGGGGNDVLQGGAGSDTVDGGAGTDTVSYEDAGAGIDLSLAITGAQNTNGSGSDRVTNVENVTGSNFDDNFQGNDAANTILGGGSTDNIDGDTYALSGSGDLLDGGAGDDNIYGRGGNDTLRGGDGADWLEGQAGNDALTGGGGADQFWFYYIRQSGFEPDLARGDDTITDFVRGQDKIGYVLAVPAGGGNFTFYTGNNQFFRFLDSNNNRVLDNADQYVDVKNVTFNGVTKLSTVIDYNAFSLDPTPGTLVGSTASGDEIIVHGVTGLTSTDFI